MRATVKSAEISEIIKNLHFPLESSGTSYLPTQLQGATHLQDLCLDYFDE